MTEPVKRKRGRPKKTVGEDIEAQVERILKQKAVAAEVAKRISATPSANENPDCELATRAYVKHLVRKTVGDGGRHSHTQGNDLQISIGLVSLVAATISFCALVAGAMYPSSPSTVAFAPIMQTLLIVSVMLLVAVVLAGDSLTERASVFPERTHDHLAKWEPPKDGGCE